MYIFPLIGMQAATEDVQIGSAEIPRPPCHLQNPPNDCPNEHPNGCVSPLFSNTLICTETKDTVALNVSFGPLSHTSAKQN